MNRRINDEQLEEGVLTEFQIYMPAITTISNIPTMKKTLTFRLAKVSRVNYKNELDFIYAYVCLENHNLYTSSIYSGGQTGGGSSPRDIRNFSEDTNYQFVEFIA